MGFEEMEVVRIGRIGMEVGDKSLMMIFGEMV
jgi:hypothetical protein